ncbi:hypothetical protein AB0M39_33710 [Streptomyces sp. NPDC051907]
MTGAVVQGAAAGPGRLAAGARRRPYADAAHACPPAEGGIVDPGPEVRA